MYANNRGMYSLYSPIAMLRKRIKTRKRAIDACARGQTIHRIAYGQAGQRPEAETVSTFTIDRRL